MKINIKQAIRIFFQNPSLEMVFIEAIANSLDAGANKIDVNISIEALDKPETLKLEIKDNGEGFTDERFKKFCELLKVEEDTHKGIGRLVYLSYFDKISVSSKYDGKHRIFTYDNEFDENNSDVQVIDIDEVLKETSIVFEDCLLKKLSNYNIVFPEYLRKRILEEFYPRLYLMKEDKKELTISINLDVQKVNKKQIIGNRSAQILLSDIPELKEEDINADNIRMFEDMKVNYSIQEQEHISQTNIITALCIDNRTYNLKDIVSAENLPLGYEMIFLLSSTLFNGQVDPSRQTLTLNEVAKKGVIKLFRNKVSEIIQREIPSIKERNNETKLSLTKNYPHLIGYFDEDEVGIIARSKAIEDAQHKFLRDQKEILEASSLNDEKYDKALDVSSRTLAEYILYREKIIGKLEDVTSKDSETDIHNIILPKGTVLKDHTDLSTIYSNNLWLLDDKYMTYTTALSDKTMKTIIEEITKETSDIKDTTEPDIAIIFSNNPDEEKNKKVDVVIVELKKRGIKLAKTEEAISQLKQRATKLMKHYPDKIQRIWFYAIVEFNDEFKLSLKNEEYTPLYSKDSLYYKENKIYLKLDDEVPYLIGTYVLSIDAFINDAKARNSTFLQLLKEGFKKHIE
jgi:anti-sigma regulatory factor (Ser/Thr protein kinase)